MLIAWCMGVTVRTTMYDGQNDHVSRVAKRPIKIRNQWVGSEIS